MHTHMHMHTLTLTHSQTHTHNTNTGTIVLDSFSDIADLLQKMGEGQEGAELARVKSTFHVKEEGEIGHPYQGKIEQGRGPGHPDSPRLKKPFVQLTGARYSDTHTNTQTQKR